MKLVILAGGLGTRISEESNYIPKPMIKIGPKPIIWHIMKYYSEFGIKDFIICGGYKYLTIQKFFQIKKHKEDWNVKVVNTGKDSNTGRRILKIKKYLKQDKFFCLTYGDGLSNIDISKLINFHKKHNSTITLSSSKPPPRFGKIIFEKNLVKKFYEKNPKDENWISIGFFVCNINIFKLFNNKNQVFERDVIPKLVKKKKATVFKHSGFWKPMDTLKEKRELAQLWVKNKAPWRIWKQSKS